jgi:hypothetical protein
MDYTLLLHPRLRLTVSCISCIDQDNSSPHPPQTVRRQVSASPEKLYASPSALLE